MGNALAEQTIKVDRDGEPTRTMRISIGLPTKADVDYDIQVEIHGPDEGDVLKQAFHGVDEWQAVRLAFRIVYDLAYSRVRTGSRLTFLGEDDWSCEPSAPVPHG